MSRGRAVALVETATELLNVAEWARATGSIDDLRVEVLAPRDHQPLRQLVRVASLVRGLGIEVRHRSVRAHNSAAVTSAGAVARSVAAADRLVIGEPFSRYVQTLLPLSRASQVIVVDDGTATWEFVRCLDEGTPMIRWHRAPQGPERRATTTTRWFTPTVRRRLTVFSCLRDATPMGATRLHNRYAWTRARWTPQVVDDHVDVLGISLVDSGLLDRSAYVGAVAELAARHGAVRYLAHRRESDGLLALIATVPGVEVVRPDLPAELFLRKGPVARRVITFPSSASHTLPVVLGDLGVRVEVRKVDPSWFTPWTTAHAREFVATIAAVAPRDPRVGLVG